MWRTDTYWFDVAIATTFGPNTLESFKVWTDEIPASEVSGAYA